MTLRLVILSVIAGLALPGCDENGEPPRLPTSGTARIDSRVSDTQSSGFSFAYASTVEFPNAEGVVPDIIAMTQISQTGEVIGVFFGAIEYPAERFRLMSSHASLNSGEVSFRQLLEVPDTTYLSLAIPISVGQLWAVKTRAGRFAKILIRHTLAYVDSTIADAPTPYSEAVFDWQYQPNGSRQF